MASTVDLPICVACATQHSQQAPSNCKICDDPRQFVPASGQQWTTLRDIQSQHHNNFTQDKEDPRVWSIATEPKVGIGQRAILLCTPHGNVLWDMIALIDQKTIDFINSKGELKAIAISHPHYYTTHAEWSAAFPGVPIHVAADDKEWFCRPPLNADSHTYLEGPQGTTKDIVPGVSIIKAGGHFPGSLLLHWDRKLLIADTIVTVPSAYTPHPRPKGQTSYVFQWSIPNCIPLEPTSIVGMWKAVKDFEWGTTHGAFMGMDIRGHGSKTEEKIKEMKRRMFESMQIQVRAEGWTEKEAEMLRQVL